MRGFLRAPCWPQPTWTLSLGAEVAGPVSPWAGSLEWAAPCLSLCRPLGPASFTAAVGWRELRVETKRYTGSLWLELYADRRAPP